LDLASTLLIAQRVGDGSVPVQIGFSVDSMSDIGLPVLR